MYICICHGITEEMIRQASTHSSRPQDVIKRLGIGESCGVCITEAIETINAMSPKALHHSPTNSHTNFSFDNKNNN